MIPFLSLLPAAALTATIFYSCADGSRSEAKRADNADYSRMTDSVLVSGNSSAPPSANEKMKSDYIDPTSGGSVIEMTEESNKSNRYFKEVFSSSGARPNALDSTHRFIRTADIKFRVKNVISSTYTIENITSRFGGYVANTHLSSEIVNQYTTKVSEDSSLETMHFVVVNSIVLRIPVRNLDTTLKSLVPLIDFLDYRNVTTNDITLDILANQLQQKRQGKFNQRLSNDIDQKGKKLDDVQSAEMSVLSSEEASDNALIENLRLDDQVRYSTITLNIYQHETFRQELVKNEKTISSYEPGLGEKLANAAEGGWHGLRAILVFLVLIWPLWLAGAITWIVVHWLLKKQKKA